MATAQDIGILQHIIERLEQRLDQNESELSKLHDELQRWNKQAHAHCPACGALSKPRAIPFYDRPLTEAVRLTLAEYNHPIGVRTLRLRLLENGYPQAKLGRYGNYLHTVIRRLVEAGIVKRLEGDEIILS